MRLGVKFSLFLSVVFLSGIFASWLAFSRLMQQHAEQEMTARSAALIETMNSVRHYTTSQINPILYDELATSPQFISQTVPAYSAREVFEALRSHPEYADYFYKEASLNPTNPRDLADDFETTLLQQYRSGAAAGTLTGFTERDGVELFYSARPLTVSADTCLACHSTPDAAPASLIATYGTENGFGWQPGEIIAAQIIYVPAASVIGAAQTWVTLIMLVVVLIFAVVILVTNFMLRRMVVKPLAQIAATARQITDNASWTPDAAQVAGVRAIATRRDEIGQTAQVFAQMAGEVYSREQQLRQEVQRLSIQIDAARREHEVKQITESDYFQNLQQKARDIRGTRGPKPRPPEGQE